MPRTFTPGFRPAPASPGEARSPRRFARSRGRSERAVRRPLRPRPQAGELRLACARPEAGGHRDRSEGAQARGNLLSTLLIWREARQLEDDQVADQDQPSLDGRVEPGRELGKATIAHPGPSTGVEERRAIERRQSQVGHRAQKRSRPAATSCGVPSTSRTTSNPLRTRRRAASRSAALTVSLSPSVPSSRRAASRARSSTSTVVRVMRITIGHQHQQFEAPLAGRPKKAPRAAPIKPSRRSSAGQGKAAGLARVLTDAWRCAAGTIDSADCYRHGG